MLKWTPVVGILLLGMAGASAAGSSEESPDVKAIKQAALDYAESWYAGDGPRMEGALHPDLAKRIVRTDAATGRSELGQMSALTLVQATRAGIGTRTPREKQQKDVTVLDVFENAASVKLVMSDWIDYMHLAKSNGKWVIVNVLWERKPKPPQ